MKIDQPIIHVKTGVKYIMKATIKAKIDGSWCEMNMYENSNGEKFARFDHDFDGFTFEGEL